MGIQEREIIEKYREMLAERGGVNVSADGVATLTAARVLKRVLEKCCIEVCGVVEQLQPEPELRLTLHQANAIIDMDNHGYSESLGPEDEGACEGWGELLELAETVTGRTANANLSDARTPRDFGDLTPPGGGRMV